MFKLFGKKEFKGATPEQLEEERKRLEEALIERSIKEVCEKTGIDYASLEGDKGDALLNALVEQNAQLKANAKVLGNNPAGSYEAKDSEETPRTWNKAFAKVKKEMPNATTEQVMAEAVKKYPKLYKGA